MDPAFDRLLLRALGILVAYWDELGLPRGHPYRQAAAMLRSYALRKGLRRD